MNGTKEHTVGVATGPGPEHKPRLLAALKTPQDGPLSASPQGPNPRHCSSRHSFLNVCPFLSGLGLSSSNQMRWLIFHVALESHLVSLFSSLN